MKVVNSTFVERYRGSILNLHPGVLPLLAGKDPQKKALDLKLKSTGNTIHIVTEKIDDSSCIIGTDEVFIDERETEESLSIKLKEKGHETYIRAINTWIQLYKNR
jgi:folate-dependent phosphoribosylglycinamide formyltransferase PurN